jgi:hypothetical protein
VPRPILKRWWLISYYELNRPFKQFQRKKHHERHNKSKIFTSLTKKFHCSRVHLWNCLINDINTPNISIKSMFSIKNNNDNKVWHSWSFIIDINFEHYWSNYKNHAIIEIATLICFIKVHIKKAGNRLQRSQ